jgi:LPS sulfotransferase NodH
VGSYLLCGTPRTGSTLLCDLLRSTGVAGRPESYFRQPDEAAWRTRLGVPPAAGYRAFAAAVARAGTTPNGVFGARVMWGSLDRVVAELGPAETDLQALESAFGPLQLIHLRRDDAVAQAVSWARAEQTGYWQHGDTATTTPRLDVDQIDALVRTVHEHEAAWADWFARQGVRPHHLTYEELVRDPGAAVRGILTHLGLSTPDGWMPVLRHRRQADDLNASWVSAHRDRGRPVVRRRAGDRTGQESRSTGRGPHLP